MSARALLALAALILAAPLRAQEEGRVLGPADYARELREVDALLAASDGAGAAARGQALAASRVAFAGEEVRPDPALLQSLAAAARPGGLQPARVRVRAAIRGLDAQGAAPAPSDPALLERARRAEQARPLEAGGQVSGLPVTPALPRRFLDAVASAWRSFTEAVERFWKWLQKLWPRRGAMAAPDGTATTWVVAVLVGAVALVMALLAVAALRRSAPAETAASEPPPASERDADPLSREQDEWEAYAAELAASGRAREAIRAWYHAVLVALFRAGLLHHHKGRTNWEYVSRVAPEASWRRELIGLTRRFDREWYGSDRSSADSLRDCAAEARGILRRVRDGAAA